MTDEPYTVEPDAEAYQEQPDTADLPVVDVAGDYHVPDQGQDPEANR